MPSLAKAEAHTLVQRRHPEWLEQQRRWRWLQDSLEGGNRYRHADYTLDPTKEPAPGYAPWYNYGFDALTSEINPVGYGQIVDRNLIPHLSETGADGRDIYAMRLHRTPVPTNVGRAIESHTSRIYSREITRKGPPAVEAWWEDVDGCGTPMDRWMLETVAPLLLVLGQIDLVLDLPEADEAADVKTAADRKNLRQDACVANIILPENLVWWAKDRRGRYTEVLAFERVHGSPRYRHWTTTDSNLYDLNGNFLAKGSHEHKLGFCPVLRVFDRKKVRCENVGQSRYESIAELQRAIYNARSELILGDVQASHAQLQGPAKFLQKGAELPVGPSNVLPMDDETGHGWEFLDPPKGAQAEVRTHIQDFQDEADRDGALLKPAGMVSGTTTGQSGVSKIADQADGNALLARIADTLARCESMASRMALAVIQDVPVDAIEPETIEVTYPKQFDLYTLDDLSAALDDLQRIASLAGALPETEGELMKRLISVALPGIDDARLGELHDEVDAYIAGAAAERLAAPEPDSNAIEGDPNAAMVEGASVDQGVSVLLTPNAS